MTDDTIIRCGVGFTSPIEHGTQDGEKTLCGRKILHLGPHKRQFLPDSCVACKRCVKKARDIRAAS